MARCKHGFIANASCGLCVVPSCWAFDGQSGDSKHWHIPCQSCGGRMVSGHNGQGTCVERVCSECQRQVVADRKRREQQEAWFYGARRWS